MGKFGRSPLNKYALVRERPMTLNINGHQSKYFVRGDKHPTPAWKIILAKLRTDLKVREYTYT